MFSVSEEFDIPKLHRDLERAYQLSAYLDFPFSLAEVANYFLPGTNISGDELRDLLSHKSFANIRFQIQDGYLLSRPGQSPAKRLDREQISTLKLNSAENFALTLAKLVPFIKTIAVTGSVAYRSATKWDDIDLFIVTQKGRLWISALMMLILVRVTKLLRLRPPQLSLFCLSYVHDELGFAKEAFENRESPLFARELLKAIPISGMKHYRELLVENDWVKQIHSKPYVEKLKEFDAVTGSNPNENTSRKTSKVLDWAEAFIFIFLSRYLRLRAYLTNLKLRSEGKDSRVFEPKMNRMSCVYTSNFYEWLHALWSQAS
jgi:hypothetical protein